MRYDDATPVVQAIADDLHTALRARAYQAWADQGDGISLTKGEEDALAIGIELGIIATMGELAVRDMLNPRLFDPTDPTTG